MSGASGSSGGVADIPVTLQSSLNQGQTGLQNTLTNLFSQGANAVFPQSQQSYAAPISQVTQDATGAFGTAVPSAGQAIATAGNVEQTGQNTLGQILTSSPTDLNSYYQQSVFNPLEQSFTQTTLPDILSASGGSVGGFNSTSNTNAVDQAVNNLYTTLAQTQSNLGYQTGQQNIANKLSALGTLSSVTGAPASTLAAAQTAGLNLQNAAQTNLSAEQTQYNQQNSNVQQFFQDILTYLNTQTQTPANQAVSYSGQGSSYGGIASGLGSLGAALLGSNLFGSSAGGAAASVGTLAALA